jgi:protein PhnA
MSVEQTLIQRCDSQCELCTSGDNLGVVNVPPSDGSAEQSIMACETCRAQLDGSAELNANHWRCLNDSMWSQVSAVQVMAWRQLTHLSTAGETWAQELLDMLYLDDETKAWAEAGIEEAEEDDSDPTLDVNGVRLTAGDTVVLIKDLPVKGTSMVAKRGTAVRGISLTSNPEHIEGRVNGQRIVIISAYTKKS